MFWKNKFADEYHGVLGQQDSKGLSIYQIFFLKIGRVDVLLGGDGNIDTARLAVRYDLSTKEIDVRRTRHYTLEDVNVCQNILKTLGADIDDIHRALIRCWTKVKTEKIEQLKVLNETEKVPEELFWER